MSGMTDREVERTLRRIYAEREKRQRWEERQALPPDAADADLHDESRRLCGAKTRAAKREGRPCQQPAGWGTDHAGYGRCKLHGGRSPSGRNSARRQMASKADPRVLVIGPDDRRFIKALIVCVLRRLDLSDAQMDEAVEAMRRVLTYPGEVGTYPFGDLLVVDAPRGKRGKTSRDSEQQSDPTAEAEDEVSEEELAALDALMKTTVIRRKRRKNTTTQEDS